MSQPNEQVATVQVQIFGGPYDGGVIQVPLAEDGTYGSITGATPGWWGLPVKRRNGRCILEWKDVVAQADLSEEYHKIMGKMELMARMIRPNDPFGTVTDS